MVVLENRDNIVKAARLNNFYFLDPYKVCKETLIDNVVSILVSEMAVDGVNVPSQAVYLDNLRKHVRVILLNLYYAHLSDLERYIAYSRDRSGYKQDKTQKGFQFSYTNVRKVADYFIGKGYVEHEKGHSSSEIYKQAHLSRMRATRELILHFENNDEGITLDDIPRDTRHEEVIVVKGLKPKPKWVTKIVDGKKTRRKLKRKRKIVKTPDTPAVRKLRINLKSINSVMGQTDIALDVSNRELRELNDRMCGDRNPYIQAVDFSRKSLHRVFLDRKPDRGGRFYGPWYQNVPKEYRPKIILNGAPVVEVDYSGYHPRILYALKGLSLPEDPYTLDDYPDSDEMRKFLKIFLLTMINSKTPNDAFDGIRGQIHEKKVVQPPEVPSLHNHILQPVMDMLIEKHEPIAEYLPSGDKDNTQWGHTLQWIDSQIAEVVMLHFTLQGYPCLPVHDSFIVDIRLEDELKEIMERVFVHNFQQDIPATDNWDKIIRIWSSEKVAKQIYKGLTDPTIDNEELEKGIIEATRILREGIEKLNTIGTNPKKK